ncbi:MAG: hypothetical protein AB7O96_08450 [Pseudobdellovibrionaceae bacterium]
MKLFLVLGLLLGATTASAGGRICSFSNNKLWIYFSSEMYTSATARIYNQSANSFTWEDLTLTGTNDNRALINRKLAGYDVGWLKEGVIYSKSGKKLSTCRTDTSEGCGNNCGGGGDGGGFFP